MTKNLVTHSNDALAHMQREINRMFLNFYNGNTLFGVPEVWSHMVDIKMSVVENDKTIEVCAELPGVEVKDINIVLRDGVLTINGEKQEEKEDQKADYRLLERSYGAFSRSVTLPADVNEEKVDAKFEKGVLKIILAKASNAHSKARKIDIKAA